MYVCMHVDQDQDQNRSRAASRQRPRPKNKNPAVTKRYCVAPGLAQIFYVTLRLSQTKLQCVCTHSSSLQIGAGEDQWFCYWFTRPKPRPKPLKSGLEAPQDQGQPPWSPPVIILSTTSCMVQVYTVDGLQCHVCLHDDCRVK